MLSHFVRDAGRVGVFVTRALVEGGCAPWGRAGVCSGCDTSVLGQAPGHSGLAPRVGMDALLLKLQS